MGELIASAHQNVMNSQQRCAILFTFENYLKSESNRRKNLDIIGLADECKGCVRVACIFPPANPLPPFVF